VSIAADGEGFPGGASNAFARGAFFDGRPFAELTANRDAAATNRLEIHQFARHSFRG